MQQRFTSRNLAVVAAPEIGRAGVGRFQFTDHYSIYDLGKMPDVIPGKGEATCRMAVDNLQMLQARGIPTHFRQAVSHDGMEFQLLRVIYPSKEQIPQGTRAYFIPLQVVFRNFLPPQASIFRRLSSGRLTLEELGFERAPEPGQRLADPVIEYMTKLDEIDEFIPRATAAELAGLTERQMRQVRELVLEVNAILSAKALSVGLCLADGKLEFGIDERGDVLLVDIAGTPDESRFLLQDLHISKQVLRDCYAATGLREQVWRWATLGRPPEERPMPLSLGEERISLVADMYKALCERWLRSRFWGAPDLESLAGALRQLQPLKTDFA